MKHFASKGFVLLFCLSVGLVVFGVPYTMLGEGAKDEEVKAPESPAAANEMMFKAILEDDVERLQKALAGGADPNAFNDDGVSALQWAIFGSRTAKTVYDQVKDLLAAGANPNLVNSHGMTPLHAAALHGDGAVVGALIESGGDPNITSAGKTPYELALITGNEGAVAAIKKTSDHQPENRAMLEALGDFSSRLKRGVIGDTTTQEKEAAVREAVRGLVQSGYISVEDGEALYQGAITQLQSHGCEDCGTEDETTSSVNRPSDPFFGPFDPVFRPSDYGTHGNEALRGQGPRLCRSFISCHGRATNMFRIFTAACFATLAIDSRMCARAIVPKAIAICLAAATARLLICEGVAVANRYYSLVDCCDGQNPNDDPEYSGCGAWNRNCPPSWYR